MKRLSHANAFLPMAGACLLGASLLLSTGCEWMPGAPKKSAEWEPEEDDLNFTWLYTENCLACHSDGETVAAARMLNDPFYLAWIPEETFRDVTLHGIENTLMPAFGPDSDTGLTDAQLEALIQGVYAWAEGKEKPTDLPPYSAPLGDADAGFAAYTTYCASCHGPDGKGTDKGGNIVDEAYLALVSDQALRSAVVAGRIDLGMPNYRNLIEGKSMSPEEISDVVAWMVSHRPDPDLLQPVANPPSEEVPSGTPPSQNAEPTATPAATPNTNE